MASVPLKQNNEIFLQNNIISNNNHNRVSPGELARFSVTHHCSAIAIFHNVSDRHDHRSLHKARSGIVLRVVVLQRKLHLFFNFCFSAYKLSTEVSRAYYYALIKRESLYLSYQMSLYISI